MHLAHRTKPAIVTTLSLSLLLSGLLGSISAPVSATTTALVSSKSIAMPPLSGSGYQQATLTAISCTSSTNCVAAGSYLDTSGNTDAFTLTYNGTAWSNPTEASLPGNAAAFASPLGISCAGSSCVTVGYYETTGIVAGSFSPFAVTSSGASETPLPTNGSLVAAATTLSSISCPSDGGCAAVGSNATSFYLSGSGPVASSQVAVETTESNYTFSAPTDAPLPANADVTGDSTLTSISCPSYSNCTAVGSYTDSSGYTQGLIETETSGSWRASEIPLPTDTTPNPSVLINAVSCVAIGECTAVGKYNGGTAFIATESGGIWSAVSAVLPPPDVSTGDPQATLNSVSCSGPGDCGAVGSYLDSSGIEVAMAMTQNSGSWSAAVGITLPAAAAAAPDSSSLTGVSCSASGSCTAVGDFLASSGVTQPMYLQSSFFSWAPAQSVTFPASAPATAPTGELNAVSCATASNCELDGYFYNASFSQLPLDVTLANGSMTQSSDAPLPSGASPSPSAEITAVSCPLVNYCVTSGNYDNIASQQLAMVDSYTPPPPPTITTITPASGPITGGSTVTITGTNFTAATAVDFGSTAANSYTVVSNTTITAVTPVTTTTGVTQVTVTTPSGTSATSTTTGYLYLAPATYTPVTPYRICDTRSTTTYNPSGLSGLNLSQCESKTLGPNATLTIQVAPTNPSGQTSGGVPSNATAVMLNVTVTSTTAASYLSVYPSGLARPLSSNLNWTQGVTTPNLVEVPIGTNGDINIYNNAGNTDVIVDVQGYVTTAPSSVTSATPGLYVPLTPYRICDTRANNPSSLSGLNLSQCESKTLGPNSSLTIAVSGTNPSGLTSGGVPSSVSAVVLNVTVTNTTAASYLTAYPAGVTQPVVSNLNWTAGETIPNRIVVPLSPNGDVTLYNNAGNTDVIVDVGGYYTSSSGSVTGATFVPMSPTRICDTRANNPSGLSGTYLTQCEGKTLTPTSTLGVTVTGGVVPTSATAVVLNVTVTNTTAASYLTAYPAGVTQPVVSDLNWTAGLTVPNLVVVKTGNNGVVNFYNNAGNVDIIVDEVGYYG